MKYAVYVPAGPQVNPAFLSDTVQSALTHLGQDTTLIIGEDGGTNRFSSLSDLGPNVHVRPLPLIDNAAHTYNSRGKFFVKKVRSQSEVVREFSFDRLLNLDDDALILNNRFLAVAEQLFATRKNAGILARFALNHEFQPLPYEGQLEEMYMQMSRNPLRARGKIPLTIQPKLRNVMRPVLQQAMANGYVLGTSFIGGSWVITRDCLNSIVQRQDALDEILKHSPSGDDDLFTIFCYACGYRVYDLLSDPPIFHIDWRKLTMSPQELVDIGASVIHSVRDPAFGGEGEVRDFFQKHREGR